MKFRADNIIDNYSWEKHFYKKLSKYINMKDSVNINKLIHNNFFIDAISCDISKSIRITKLLYDNKDLYEIDWDTINSNTMGFYEQLIFSFPFYCLHNKYTNYIIDDWTIKCEPSEYKKYRIMLFNRMFYYKNDKFLFI